MTKLTADQAKIVVGLMNAPQLTVSAMIEALQEIEREHGGELPVVLHDDTEAREVCAYDANGDTRGPRIEVVIHGVR